MDLFNEMMAFINEYGEMLVSGTWDTLIMTTLATLFAYVLGIPLGVLLVVTSPNGLHPMRVLNSVVGWIVNVGRSIPFIILIVAIIPFTRLVVGTSIGVRGAIVPLVVAAAPFVARVVEQSLAEVDGGLIEAAQSFGASNWQIVRKVLLRESLPSIIRGLALTFVSLFGYAAMAGTVGAGGLGDIAVRYGYQRHMYGGMLVAVILCIVIVQVAQSVCNFIARKIDHR